MEALGVKKRTPSYCARSYTEVLPAGCWNDASRASIQKDEGSKRKSKEGVTNSPSHWGRKTNRHLDVIQAFSILVGKERRSPSEPSNEE